MFTGKCTNKPLKIAHRGGPTVYPEQTVASAKQALRDGADMVELDVRLSRDGELVVSHDASAMRVFGALVDVASMTAEEFSSLRHKDASDFSAHLFIDYINAEVFPLLIHIKVSEAVAPLISCLKEAGCIDKVVLGVASPDEAREAIGLYPDIRLLSFAKREDIPEMIELGCEYIRLWEPWLSEESVNQIKSGGAKLAVMTGEAEAGYPVGEPSDDGIRRVLSYSPDAILINDVRRIG